MSEIPRMKYPDDFINKIICGDCLEVIKEMPDKSIDMVMTSPPYWGLRDYGTGTKQLGLEPTPEMYIEHLTQIFNGVKRVLKKEGTFWLNMGDTYNSGGGTSTGGINCFKRTVNTNPGTKNLPSKCLLMIPERLAWSLIQNGWILRNKIIWYKPNAMPSSVRDRYSNRWEYIFMFSKDKKYYFDLDSVREPHHVSSHERYKGKYTGAFAKEKMTSVGYKEANPKRELNPLGKNPGDIWIINTIPYPIKGVHFATFPEELCKKAITPGCPEGGVVFDPFCGIGTACYVAQRLKRKFIGIDIKPEYCKKAENIRLAQGVLPL